MKRTICLLLSLICVSSCKSSNQFLDGAPIIHCEDLPEESLPSQRVTSKANGCNGLFCIENGTLLLRYEDQDTLAALYNVKEDRLEKTLLYNGARGEDSCLIVLDCICDDRGFLRLFSDDKLLCLDINRSDHPYTVDSCSLLDIVPWSIANTQHMYWLQDKFVIVQKYEGRWLVSQLSQIDGTTKDIWAFKDSGWTNYDYGNIFLLRPDGYRAAFAMKHLDKICFLDLHSGDGYTLTSKRLLLPDRLIGLRDYHKDIFSRTIKWFAGCATQDYLFLIYYDKPFNDIIKRNCFPCLYIFDWDGTPIKKSTLNDNQIISIAAEDNGRTLYSLSMSGEIVAYNPFESDYSIRP